MGILANTVSICHYRVEGEGPPQAELFDWVSERLARQAFQPIDEGIAEISVGWVHLNNSREAAFVVPGDFWYDHYLAFSLRQDKRTLPGALLRAHLQAEEADFLAVNPGYRRVPKRKKEELREKVRASLLARTLPVPTVHDLVWDIRSGILTFTALGRGTVDTFESLFKKTFPELRLALLYPFARAEAVVDGARRGALELANRATSDAVLDRIRSNLWLGGDLFLWLLYRTMNGPAEYRVCRPGPALEGDTFLAYLNDRFVLSVTSENGRQKITVAGPQDRFGEVCTALRFGKTITEATIYFERGDDIWKLTLKGEMFQFASFRSPKVQEERDDTVDAGVERESLLYERMYLLETGIQLFDSLFAAFLDLRLSPAWEGEMGRIAEWLATEDEGEGRPVD